MVPDFGDVERIDAVGRRVGFRHRLHAERPRREVLALDRVVEILVAVELVLSAHHNRFLGRETLDALVGLEVELHPVALAPGVHPQESVGAEAVHAAVGRRDAAIAEEDHELVRRLGRVRKEVPHVVRLLAVREWVLLLRVDEVGELDAVADEKHGRVVAHQIPVAVFRVVLHCEAARIARDVGAAARRRHGREADEHVGLLADLLEDLHLRPLRHVGAGHLEVAVRAGADRVDDALGNPLAVEPRQFLDEVLVLQERGAGGTRGLRILVVSDREKGSTVRRCVIGEIHGHTIDP